MARSCGSKCIFYLFLCALTAVLGGCSKPVGEQLADAANTGNVDEVNRILDQNPGSVNDCDDSAGITVLEFGVIGGHIDVVKTLLDHGANVDTFDKLGYNPLYYAIGFNYWPIAQLLIDHGAKIKGVRFGPHKDPPLCIAACAGLKPIVLHLLALGADPNVRDDEGYTAADLARQGGYNDVATLLEEHMTTMPTTRN